jgi:hypothetical protein
MEIGEGKARPSKKQKKKLVTRGFVAVGLETIEA